MWNDAAIDELDPPESGCQWPIVGNCEVCKPLDDDVAAWTQQMAIEILWAASGRQFGLCVADYRVCSGAAECDVTNTLSAWDLVGRHGTSFAFDPWAGSVFARFACGCGRDRCSCTSYPTMRLWHRRVRSMISVTIDGTVLDPSAYQLNGNRLLRTDGNTWPSCQDWGVADGEAGSMSVSYLHGRQVPYGGQVAAGILSCELGKALTEPENCALPKRVQTVSRAGVTVGFVDPMAFISDGLTGVYEVDLWIRNVNPHRLQRRARVFSANDPRRKRRTRA